MSNIYHVQISVSKEVFNIMDKSNAEFAIRRKLAFEQLENINKHMTIARIDENSTDTKIFKSSVGILSVDEYKQLKEIEEEFYRLTELLGRNTREDDSDE